VLLELPLPLTLPLPVALPLPLTLPLPVALPLPLVLLFPLVLSSERVPLLSLLPRTEVSLRVFTSVEQPAVTSNPNRPVAMKDFNLAFIFSPPVFCGSEDAFHVPAR
jgi:hypothetical protein